MKPERIRELIHDLKSSAAERRLSAARSLLVRYFNGGAPYTDEQVETYKIFTNVQTMRGPRLLMDARRQLAQVHQGGPRLFEVIVHTGADTDSSASAWITARLNRLLRRDREYQNKLFADDASLVLFGVSLGLWHSPHEWRPRFTAVEDVKFPRHTYADLSNLTHFAVRADWTAAELIRILLSRRRVRGWNETALRSRVRKLLSTAEPWSGLSESDWEEYFPEKLADDFRSGAAWFDRSGGGLSLCPLWFFYELREENDRPAWHLTVLADKPDDQPENDILFRSDEPVADHVDRILSAHYADGSCKPPFLYHSIRGLAYLLYPGAHLLDRAFCRVVDAGFDAMNQYYRDQGDPDRADDLHVILPNYSVIPPGVSFVNAQERYTVSHLTVRTLMDVLNQVMSDQASSYTSEIADGTRASMTATEASARMATAAQLSEGIFSLRSLYLRRELEEICRRFCRKPSNGRTDPDVEAFQNELRSRFGDRYLNFDDWEILVERSGGSNPLLQMQRANLLFVNRSAFPPDAQTRILRDWTATVTGDPDKAFRLVPETEPPVNNSVLFARLAIGSLLNGISVELPGDIDLTSYALTIGDSLMQRFNLLNNAGTTPNSADTAGFVLALGHWRDVLETLAADPAKQPLVAGLSASWSQMMDTARRWVNENAAVDDLTPKQRAEIAAIMAKNELKLEQARNRAALNEMERLQQLEHREREFKQRLAIEAARARNEPS